MVAITASGRRSWVRIGPKRRAISVAPCAGGLGADRWDGAVEHADGSDAVDHGRQRTAGQRVGASPGHAHDAKLSASSASATCAMSATQSLTEV